MKLKHLKVASGHSGLRRQAQRAAALGTGCAGGESAVVASLCQRIPNHRRVAGFTMVEIALCLAIVGFALIAIIGVLPAGLNVQKENREETIVNQEATIWMDALRSGSFGYDELTRHVDRIVIATNLYNAGGLVATGTNTFDGPFANGGVIVGLLSTPRLQIGPAGSGTYTINHVFAFVRAMSGSAADKPPQDSVGVKDFAFSYRLVVENTPAGSYDLAGILTNRVDNVLFNNLTDMRLLFRWPLKKPYIPGQPDPEAGNSRLAFRTQVSGRIVEGSHASISAPLYFHYPRDYRQ
jgi:type II secretory pathway pseudopilin PulG